MRQLRAGLRLTGSALLCVLLTCACARDDYVTVYFTRGEARTAVQRAAGPSGDLPAALNALLAGPTAEERAAGISSWFSAATADALISAHIDGAGNAVIDLRDLRSVIPNASSSAGSAILLGELNATTFQFDQVQTIEYRMNGSCDAFGEWLQFGCVRVSRP